jgi:hypothetical protein
VESPLAYISTNRCSCTSELRHLRLALENAKMGGS